MKSGHAGTPLKRRWNGRPRPACRGPSCLASGAPWPRRPGHLLRAGLRRQGSGSARRVLRQRRMVVAPHDHEEQAKIPHDDSPGSPVNARGW